MESKTPVINGEELGLSYIEANLGVHSSTRFILSSHHHLLLQTRCEVTLSQQQRASTLWIMRCCAKTRVTRPSSLLGLQNSDDYKFHFPPILLELRAKGTPLIQSADSTEYLHAAISSVRFLTAMSGPGIIRLESEIMLCLVLYWFSSDIL